MSFRSDTAPSTAAAGVVFEEVDSLFEAAVAVAVVGTFVLAKFSLSLSAYLFASWRSFSANVSELALSISNRDRLLVLKELGVRMVAATEAEDTGVVLIDDESSAAVVGFVVVDVVVFVNSSESVFL